MNASVPAEVDLAPLAKAAPLPPCMSQLIRQATKVSIHVEVGLAPLAEAVPLEMRVGW